MEFNVDTTGQSGCDVVGQNGIQHGGFLVAESKTPNPMESASAYWSGTTKIIYAGKPVCSDSGRHGDPRKCLDALTDEARIKRIRVHDL